MACRPAALYKKTGGATTIASSLNTTRCSPTDAAQARGAVSFSGQSNLAGGVVSPPLPPPLIFHHRRSLILRRWWNRALIGRAVDVGKRRAADDMPGRTSAGVELADLVELRPVPWRGICRP